jgi:hypothetical protein
MVPDFDAEKGWGGLVKQKFFESFRLSTHQRRIKGYGAPARFGPMGGSLVPLSQTPVHTKHSLKVALCPYGSPPTMGAWAWNIGLISGTYYILRLPLSLCQPPSDNPLRLCEIPSLSALSLAKPAFSQGQIITFM